MLNLLRLKNRADFIRCRNGTRAHERAFVLQLIQHDLGDDNTVRVGFTVTKKIGNAVVRNRIKRRLREAVKRAQLPSQVGGYDAVLIARDAALHLPFDDLIDDIRHGFSHAIKIKNKRHVANSAYKRQKPHKNEPAAS